MPRFEPHPDRRPAVVTGASSGIGARPRWRWPPPGHPVVLGARRVERCEEVAAEIRAAGGEASALPLDLTDGASVDGVRRRAARRRSATSRWWCPTPATCSPITTVGADPGEFTRQVQVNLLGAQALVHRPGAAHGRPAPRRRRVRHLRGGRDPRPHMAAYVASKAGLEGFARG